MKRFWRLLSGALFLYAVAALALWLFGEAFSVVVPITIRSVAAAWALIVIVVFMAFLVLETQRDSR